MSDTLDRITESVKRCRIMEYPDQLGKRTIATNFEELEGKKVSDRRNHNLIDLDHPDVLKNRNDIPANDRYFDMLRLEKLAKDKGFKRSDTFNEAFEDTGRDQYPIIADVLLQITMVRVYSTFKITESVNIYVGIGRKFSLFFFYFDQTEIMVLINKRFYLYRLFLLCTFHSNDDILGTPPVK
ncbi:uncharacterized protein EV154DRAFT_552268 [Mucor mucedo]|uniref:uncharacterized protein n=1 Tax=Mucor mucedo TaxID=29922 RepID=UPI002220B4A1|nr:uncharacterized protein EV154DRAFT_552268 [Mucor mucedo]KAI7890454.1 hypothetical protein EV154DRAFT_552268 [Mucor mucedo]